jgi:solute:Na+ symporter, SSS family
VQLTWIDGIILVAYFTFVIIVGLKFRSKAGKSIEDYFVSGRSLPWWLAGTSMVATTFAADTPLAVTGLVANHGIAGNWLWWNMVFSGLLTVFLFARLWRRSGVLTDVEFTEIRYSGRPAAFLRGFRALYLAIPINGIITGWVMLAMAKIMSVTLGIDKWLAVSICVLFPFIYSFLAGLWGVVITDFFQFFLAIAGTIILAFYAINAVGGMDGLYSGLSSHYENVDQLLAFTPDIGSAWMPLTTFLVYIAVNWWAAWYPGAEPGGGGYVAQRMFAAKDEKHAVGAVLWFNIAHYCLRPWPWILVALASLVLYPNLADPETGYIKVMVDTLPVGIRGLLLATFAAAFMSTISTQLNWGSSYLVNDIYLRFIKKDASNRHQVFASKIATIIILLVGAFTTWRMDSISGAWKLLLALGAGTGLVYILRWYWWRINAWSEISAMIASFVGALILQYGFGLDSDDPEHFAFIMLGTLMFSTIIWVSVTYLTKPESDATLVQFYKKVKPSGPGWRKVTNKAGLEAVANTLPMDLLAFFTGSVMIYSLLFGIGKFIFGDILMGSIYCLIGAISGFSIFKMLEKSDWKSN